MPARKSHCDHFAPIFVPRSLTASQIWLGIIFQKNVENCIVFSINDTSISSLSDSGFVPFLESSLRAPYKAQTKSQ